MKPENQKTVSLELPKKETLENQTDVFKTYRSDRGTRLLIYKNEAGKSEPLKIEYGSFTTCNPLEQKVIEENIAKEKLLKSHRTLYTADEWDEIFTPDKVFMEVGKEDEKTTLHKKQVEALLEHANKTGFKIPQVQVFDTKFRGTISQGVQSSFDIK